MKISIEYSLKRMESSKKPGHWEDHVDTYIEEEIFELVLDELKKSCEDDLASFHSHPMIPSTWIEDVMWGDENISLKIGTFVKTLHYEAMQNDKREFLSNTEKNTLNTQELVYDTLTFDVQNIAKQLFAKSAGFESYPSYDFPWIRINSIQVRRDDEE
jgi:hypothetical protein